MNIVLFNSYSYGIEFGIEMTCAIICLLFAAAMRTKMEGARDTRAFYIFLISMGIEYVLDATSFIASGNKDLKTVLIVSNALYIIFAVAAAIYFYYYIVAHMEIRYGIALDINFFLALLILGVIVILAWIASVWTGLFYYVDEGGAMHAGKYSMLAGILLSPTLLASVYVTIKNRAILDKKERTLYLTFAILYMLFGAYDAFFFHSTVCIVGTVFACLIFVSIMIEQEIQLQKKEAEVVQSELNSLRLQMNPHYIYNTLASIDGLIVIDPDEARRMINNFVKHLRGTYLRDMPQMIQFSEELRNIEYYVSVEKTRFPGLTVEYDIKTKNFELPPLVVQPILENAIKHGICAKEDATGCVVLSAFEDERNYHIVISDDGVGFDPEKAANDGGTHIGINNTRKRLELLCGGELRIKSSSGEGTTVEIMIPKEK